MVKIVVTQELRLGSEDIDRLKKLGELTLYDDLPKNSEEWLERCKGADIICSGKFGLRSEKVYELENVFLSLPFVGVGFLDKDRLKERNITVSYSPGCNKDAVSEWIVGMIINMLRELLELINNTDLPKGYIPEQTLGLTNKKITILGKGNIGKRVGNICKALDMDVSYFQRGDDLINSVEGADVIVNVLSMNSTTKNILDNKFFNSLKKGSFFVTVTSRTIFDTDAMLEALDNGVLRQAAVDAGGVQVGDVHDPYYRKLVEHSKVLVVPHLSYCTDVTDKVSYGMMVDNIEAWLKGKPINILD